MLMPGTWSRILQDLIKYRCEMKSEDRQKKKWSKPKLTRLKFNQTLGGLDSHYVEGTWPGVGTS